MDVIIYTKEKCPRCLALKKFLDSNKIFYLEKNIEDKMVLKEIMTYQEIIDEFCDESQCLVLTPVINIDGKWMHKEFFDSRGVNEKAAKKLLNIK